jgi:hypothetical protein
MRARLAIGTGLLAAGMLLVAPAATAFAGPGIGGSCAGSASTKMFCHHNRGGTAETAGSTATDGADPSPMSRQPCGRPAPDDSTDDADAAE